MTFGWLLAVSMPRFDPAILPAGLGMLAVWLLLPAVRPRSNWPGAMIGVAALALGAWVLSRDSSATRIETLLFYSFAGLALLGAVLLVTQPNPAQGAIAFALVVLSTCGLFLLQAAPFLMAGTIIIYAGAIIVTFLFVIMLSQPRGSSDADARTREPLLACLAGFLLLGIMLSVVREHYDIRGVKALVDAIQTARETGRSDDDLFRELKRHFTNDSFSPTAIHALSDAVDELQNLAGNPKTTPEQIAQKWDAVQALANTAQVRLGDVIPPETIQLSAFGGRPSNIRGGVSELPASNVPALGRVLFSDYLLAVELGGTLLLVATIGAIAITGTRSRKPGVRSANNRETQESA